MPSLNSLVQGYLDEVFPNGPDPVQALGREVATEVIFAAKSYAAHMDVPMLFDIGGTETNISMWIIDHVACCLGLLTTRCRQDLSLRYGPAVHEMLVVAIHDLGEEIPQHDRTACLSRVKATHSDTYRMILA